MTRVLRHPAIRLAIAVLGVAATSTVAAAQTTITLSQPESQAWFATVRGGSYANRNLSTILETRSSTDPEYLRRALLKFDTQTTIPAGASVSSAILTVTVKAGSTDATRRIGAYQVTTSWEDSEVTYNVRRTSTAWSRAGGDLGTKLTEQVVSNVAGTRVSFDVTPLVQQAVAGQLGTSRYTRIALVDLDGSTNESWRAYNTSSDSNTSVRPKLTVTYGGSATPTTTTTTTTSGSVMRVLSYNIHRNGWGTDGVYDPNRVANWVVRMRPDVIAFQEMEKCSSYSQGANGVALYKSLLEQKTGMTWYVFDAQDYGNWTGCGMHNAVFSRFPLRATYRTIFSAGRLRTVAGATITFNGRNINFMSTHFDPYETSYRLQQARDLITYMDGFAENRIVAGDFNDQEYDSPITTMTTRYYDAWAEAKRRGVAYSASDNPYGYTRNSRIDYIFYSRTEQHLTLRRVEVVDTRDSSGDMPSDHKPLLAEFLVQ